MDTFNRFIEAQDQYGYAEILAEIQQGEKTGHWMWFVFPQLRGLGRSSTSHFYGLSSLAQAKAYWEHPVVGNRLREALASVFISGNSAKEIFGEVDTLKLHSCVTLFLQVVNQEPLLLKLLKDFFNNRLDKKTINLLK